MSSIERFKSYLVLGVYLYIVLFSFSFFIFLVYFYAALSPLTNHSINSLVSYTRLYLFFSFQIHCLCDDRSLLYPLSQVFPLFSLLSLFFFFSFSFFGDGAYPLILYSYRSLADYYFSTIAISYIGVIIPYFLAVCARGFFYSIV